MNWISNFLKTNNFDFYASLLYLTSFSGDVMWSVKRKIFMVCKSNNSIRIRREGDWEMPFRLFRLINFAIYMGAELKAIDSKSFPQPFHFTDVVDFYVADNLISQHFSFLLFCFVFSFTSENKSSIDGWCWFVSTKVTIKCTPIITKCQLKIGERSRLLPRRVIIFIFFLLTFNALIL